VDLLALATPARMGANANDRDHFARQRQFNSLNDFGRHFAGHDSSVAVRAFDAMKLGVVHLVIGKERPLVTRMAWLPAAFSFLAVLWFVFRVAVHGRVLPMARTGSVGEWAGSRYEEECLRETAHVLSGSSFGAGWPAR
jgi:hypothetical protein